MSERVIYTIGHSTHPLEIFITMLQSFKIKLVVDVRSLPGSTKYPQYNQQTFQRSLAEAGIQYQHCIDLGGRRKAKEDSINTRWRNKSFMGYADYMETAQFKTALNKLELTAKKEATAMMCAEAVWWRCHRSMIADNLKVNGWTVLHIMGADLAKEHPFTQPAREVDGKLFYSNPVQP